MESPTLDARRGRRASKKQSFSFVGRFACSCASYCKGESCCTPALFVTADPCKLYNGLPFIILQCELFGE